MTANQSERFGTGLVLALVSAFSFSLAGPLAAGLLATGWTPLALVIFRLLIGSVVMAGPALLALRGRFGLLRRDLRRIITFGVVGVALPQIAYFNAVQYLQIAQALLIQYLAPVALVALLWIRLGERPGLRTMLGGVVAMAGLVLVLQVFGSQAELDWRGLVWALAALVGNSAYFLFAADDTSTLPPPVLACSAAVVALLTMCAVALVGLLPFQMANADASLAGAAVPFWMPLVLLGLVSSGVSYLSGIAAARSLGTRLASFLGLSEVLFAALLSTVLLGQQLAAGQLLGGALVLSGVVLVKLGESRIGVPKLPARR